jgi:hypothetical protein
MLFNDVPLNDVACVDEDSPPKSCRPAAVLDILDASDNEVCPRLIDRNGRKCFAFPHNNLGAPRSDFAGKSICGVVRRRWCRWWDGGYGHPE